MLFSSQKQKIKLKIRPRLTAIGLAFFVSLYLPADSIQARIFNPHNILTDQEVFQTDGLSKTAIQTFLERENSVLARYSQTIDGVAKKVSEIVWEIGQKHSVSSKFLLATLEKEQGLIHSSQATEKALDWATGYSCFGGSCNEKHQGLYNQVEATAETQKIYRQRASQFGFRVGVETNSTDGFAVTPQNQATANLYIYTPYVGYSPELGVTQPYGGNRLLWRVWQRYFTNQKFLDGQVLTSGGSYYLISNNTKRKFASAEIFAADHQPAEAISVGAKDLASYPDGPLVYFSNNTLVRSASSGQLFLLTENQKRPILEESALALLSDVRLALSSSDVPTVAEEKLAGYVVGSFISSASIYPQGKLVKDETGAIWQVKDGLKHPVDSVVWTNRFNNQPAEPMTSGALQSYPTGGPVLLKDGTFVKSQSGSYYLITNAERMKIEDVGIFNRVFGPDKMNKAVTISNALLEAHGASDVIDYIDETIQDSAAPAPSGPTGSYAAAFASLQPEGLVLVNGATAVVTVSFKNTGSQTWQPGEVWLSVTDRGQASSSFGAAAKINFNEPSVGSDQLATFTVNLTAPANQNGLLSQQFTLYHKPSAPIELASVGKFIIVNAGLTATVSSHNVPVAVRNNWKPITITVKIQNTSKDTTWLSRRTALEIYDGNGAASPFHDPNDWVNTKVAAVPINKSSIAPGEVGEFKFTLDPRGIKPGTHTLNLQLKLLDKAKQVYLNGKLEWRLLLRVD